jgi:uncharacterized protein YcbX
MHDHVFRVCCRMYDITVGDGVRFYGSSRCDRCVMTTTEQTTGEQAGLDGEPLAVRDLLHK